MASRLLLDSGKIKQLRKTLGLSQEKLAQLCEQKRLRISIATIKRAELGKPVSVRTAKEFSEIFGIQLSELIKQEQSSNHDQFLLPNAPKYLPLLWFRTNQWQLVESAYQLLSGGGAIAIEQLGNTLIAIFEPYGSHGKGIIQAQIVATKLKQMVESHPSQAQFYAALTIGPATKAQERLMPGREPLQWFAQAAPNILANSIVVSDPLYKLTKDKFVYKKHKDLWQILPGHITPPALPIAGREKELQQIIDLLDDAKQRPSPCLINISGPSGLGKSRLLQRVIELAEQKNLLRGCIELEGKQRRSTIQLAFDLSHQYYSAAKKRCGQRLEAKLNELQYDEPVNQTILNGLLHGTTEELNGLDIHDEKLVEQLYRVSNDLTHILYAAVNTPIIVIVDNIHLADHQAFPAITEMLLRSQDIPLLIFISNRSDNQTQKQIDQLPLNGIELHNILLSPLTEQECNTLCSHYTTLSPQVIEECKSLSDGIPLYLTQLLSARHQDPESTQLPEPLQLYIRQQVQNLNDEAQCLLNLLCTHPDALPTQVCLELVQRVLQNSSLTNLNEKGINELVRKQLIRTGNQQQLSIALKLVKKVLYAALSNQSRLQYHKLIAEHLSAPNQGEHGPALDIAYHFEHSNQHYQAANHLYRHAVKLIQHADYNNARTTLDRALNLLSDQEATAANIDLEIDIQLCLAGTDKANFGWVSSLLKSSYQRVTSLFEVKPADARLTMALFGLWVIELVTLNFSAAERLIERCFEIARDMGDHQGEMHAYIASANTKFWQGQHDQALAAAQRALGIYRDESRASSIQFLGQDPRTLAGCFGALSASVLGKPAEAEACRKVMLDAAELPNHHFSSAVALFGSTWLDYHLGNPEQTLQSAMKLDALSTSMNYLFYQGTALLFIGWSKHKLGMEENCADIIEQAYHSMVEPGTDKIGYSLYSCLLGEVLLETGQSKRAESVLRSGIEFAKRYGENCYLAEMYRLLAMCCEKERTSLLEQAQNYAKHSPLFAKRIVQLAINSK